MKFHFSRVMAGITYAVIVTCIVSSLVFMAWSVIHKPLPDWIGQVS